MESDFFSGGGGAPRLHGGLGSFGGLYDDGVTSPEQFPEDESYHRMQQILSHAIGLACAHMVIIT